MKVVVLGAGVVGVASAWYLARAGHEVLVADRQPEPALETSFANGGQISVSHAEPWANPAAPLKVLRWLGREDAPLLFRLRADWQQWRWCLQFLVECLPRRAHDNIRQIVTLALYSRAQLQQLRGETGIEYDHQARGILHFYTDAAEFAHGVAQAELMRQYGCDRQVKTLEECVAIEPALANARVRIVGGTYTASDESGDAHLFAKRLAELAVAAGVSFRFNVSVKGIETERGQVTRAVIDDEQGIEESLRADAYVMALGSYSTPLLRQAGISIPVYPAKGYSITLPLKSGTQCPPRAPSVSLTDDGAKLVFSRLGERLRVAGTAELNGYDTDINIARCEAILKRTFDLFPLAGRRQEAVFWTGLRPSTPSNLPVIGRTRYPNLYVNTGHGTLGWTLCCGSGRALADIISGRQPEPDFRFFGMEPAAKRTAVSAAPRLTG